MNMLLEAATREGAAEVLSDQEGILLLRQGGDTEKRIYLDLTTCSSESDLRLLVEQECAPLKIQVQLLEMNIAGCIAAQ